MQEQYFNFELEPGKQKENRKYNFHEKIISVIIPYYNDKDYILQTVTCVLNQTFPNYEILIIDDGSTEEESLKKLEEIEKIDERIKVLHKQNEGLAATRDYGAKHASSDSKYFMFLDADDLIEKTFLECAYWTLETNENASWAYSDSVRVWNR